MNGDNIGKSIMRLRVAMAKVIMSIAIVMIGGAVTIGNGNKQAMEKMFDYLMYELWKKDKKNEQETPNV